MHRINATLLEKLFVSPAPLGGDSEELVLFTKLKCRMFPGEEAFMSFLTAQSGDIQFENAEKIIHRLCFESNFPPPFFVLKDVLCVEEYQKRTISEYDSYVPRDHFLHIVNLYLLGIYVFFYNAEFHSRLLNENRFQRTVVRNGQFVIDSYKDFISEWKYFCLYHDVGYVQELLANELKFDNIENVLDQLTSEKNDFCNSISKNQIIQQNAFFGSIEVLSRIISWKIIKNNSKSTYDGDSNLFRFFRESCILVSSKPGKEISFDEDCKPKLKGLVKLERVYSNQCLKPLLPIIGDTSVVIVGVNRFSGEVSFLSLVTSGKRELYFLADLINDEAFSEYISDPSLMLFDDFSPTKYELLYLCDIKNATRSFPLRNFYNNDDIDDIYKFFSENDFNLKFACVSNEKQLLDFYFDIYLFLYKYIKSFNALTPSDKHKEPLDLEASETINTDEKVSFGKCDEKTFAWKDKLSSVIQKLVLNSYSSEIEETCQTEINNYCKPKIMPAEITLVEETVKNYIDQYYNKLRDLADSKPRKSRFAGRVKVALGRDISVREAVISSFVIGYHGLRQLFTESYDINDLYWFDYSSRKACNSFPVIQSHLPSSLGGKKVSAKKFMNIYLDNLTKDNETYLKRYKKAKTLEIKREAQSKYRSGCDHGFESAKYASSVFDMLQASLQNASTKERRALVDILFSVSSCGDRKRNIAHYIDDYRHIFKNVIYAIVIHNLWPSVFTKEDKIILTTSIEETPFAYLALLCDSLQQWNRPQGLSHSLTDMRPYKAASEFYDVVVSSNKIEVYEASTDEMQERLSGSIQNLSFLKNVKAYVKNGKIHN